MGERKFLLGPYFVLGQWDYTKESESFYKSSFYP